MIQRRWRQGEAEHVAQDGLGLTIVELGAAARDKKCKGDTVNPGGRSPRDDRSSVGAMNGDTKVKETAWPSADGAR
ncbi:hypothetical protein NDU88_004965 [Pleurodeles waltl]|uniref:Uncharacterized protein n=1 Tax=Pleurodeles waltl TaxID=8319 RepID=A0AAV7NMI7_PLEWA|nr:hypothetical protein NDU88_004965 [Pleurodeles waltl]